MKNRKRTDCELKREHNERESALKRIKRAQKSAEDEEWQRQVLTVAAREAKRDAHFAAVKAKTAKDNADLVNITKTRKKLTLGDLKNVQKCLKGFPSRKSRMPPRRMPSRSGVLRRRLMYTPYLSQSVAQALSSRVWEGNVPFYAHFGWKLEKFEQITNAARVAINADQNCALAKLLDQALILISRDDHSLFLGRDTAIDLCCLLAQWKLNKGDNLECVEAVLGVPHNFVTFAVIDKCVTFLELTLGGSVSKFSLNLLIPFFVLQIINLTQIC